MRKSLLKPLVYVLVAAQLLLAVPAVSFAQSASMQSMASGDHCPCCPNASDSMKDCLASCALAAVAVSDTQVPVRVSAPSERVDAPPAAPLVSLSDPPLKPPPIH